MQAGILNPGIVKAKPKGNKWSLESNADDPKTITDTVGEGSINHSLEVTTAKDFRAAVDKELTKCLPTKSSQLPKTLPDKLKLVTLCAMREHVNADMAIVQKRDFFATVPAKADDEKVHVQQFLIASSGKATC